MGCAGGGGWEFGRSFTPEPVSDAAESWSLSINGLASDLHERLFGHRPAVKAIHAGLECDILKSKKPDVDILSFGPTIRGAHSPTERLHIETVAPFWQFLTQLLAEI